MTEELTVWVEIVRDFEDIKEPEIRRVQRNLGPARSGETPLGALHSEALKRLWALATRYDGLSKQAVIDSEHKAETEAEANEFHIRAARFVALEDITRSLFWTQAKDDIGAWDSAGTVGVRADWMLVSSAGPRAQIAEILGKLIQPPE